MSRTIKDRGALPVAEACDYIRQAAIGLQHAHECGMVHRDIKPHNLMVTALGTVKILDFGLASLAPEAIADAKSAEARSDLTAAGAIMGTPDFISPEQAEDARQADIRSDIYSLGATLYYLLSGRVPFADGSVMHKLRSQAQIEPDSLKTLRMRRAEVTNDLLLEIDVRQAGPLLLESLPSEAQAPEVYPVIEQTVEILKRISLTVKQTADTPIRARFEAIDAEKANQLHALASVWFETAKGGWPKVREMIRERPAEKDTKLANALAEQIDAVLPASWLAIDKDQLLVRVEKQGGVDLAALLVFFLLID